MIYIYIYIIHIYIYIYTCRDESIFPDASSEFSLQQKRSILVSIQAAYELLEHFQAFLGGWGGWGLPSLKLTARKFAPEKGQPFNRKYMDSNHPFSGANC